MPKPVQRVNATALGTEVVMPGGAGVILPDWWDPNTVGLPVVAAYRAINTPANPWPNDAPGVYLDTLVNNANPGTFDLVEGNGGVPWVANIGWSFLGAGAAQWLDTGIVAAKDQSYSIFAQYANAVIAVFAPIAGSYNGAPGPGFLGVFEVVADIGTNFVQYGNGGFRRVVPALITGNLAVVGGTGGYRNGVQETGAFLPWDATPNPFSVYIGARNNIGAPLFVTADIESVAIYAGNVAGVQAEALAIATAMTQL